LFFSVRVLHRTNFSAPFLPSKFRRFWSVPSKHRAHRRLFRHCIFIVVYNAVPHCTRAWEGNYVWYRGGCDHDIQQRSASAPV